MGVIVCMVVSMIVLVVVIMGVLRRGPGALLGHNGGEAGRFIGQGEQRISFGTGELAAALFTGKKHDETAG